MKKEISFPHRDDLEYWLALSSIADIGPITIKRLLSVFHSPRKILEANFKDLTSIADIGELRARKIYKFSSWDEVEKEIKAIDNYGIKVIKYTDREYPESLRQIEDSPIILYVNGSFAEDDRYGIAMVGSRRMTEYGKRIAEKIASELVLLGFTIVSGMARGIDTISHKTALKAGGRSIAVLGCGLDRPYPPENIKLFEALTQSGCVVSEFPPGTPPSKENFPKRNRLISGFSVGVLVIEATMTSGSLITANHALEQGKEVFAIPGSITSRNSEGTNALIKKGAKLVQRVEDIIEELSPLLKGLIGQSKDSYERNSLATPKGVEINDAEKAICNILGSEPKHIDEIAREAKTPPARLSGLLLGLEIKGIVKQTEGKRFYI